MRDYKKEYREYHSSKTQKLRRAMRNKANRKLKPGPGKEVDHKTPLSAGGSNSESNWRVVSKSTNRKKYNKTADMKPNNIGRSICRMKSQANNHKEIVGNASRTFS